MKKEPLFFLLGVLVGGVVGSTLTYILLNKKEGIGEKIEVDDVVENLDDTNKMEEFKNNEEEIREKLLKNWDKPPLKVSEDEMAEHMHPTDSDEDEFEDASDTPFDEVDNNHDLGIQESIENDEYHKKNKGKKPKIISKDDLDSVPSHFETSEWVFWAGDDVVTDDDGSNVIEDPERFVGDCLDKYDFRNNDEEELYILSYEYDTLFVITKYFKSYGSTHEAVESYVGINEEWES